MNLAGGPLADSDLRKLSTCAITADLAQQAMLRRVDSAEGASIVGRNGSGDYAGILFPYIWPGDQHVREYRLRRDKPDLEPKPGGGYREKDKYLSPPGRSNQLYFTPGTEAAWLGDVTLPILISEGEKKAISLWGLAWHQLGDAAEKPRFLPVGIPGVWNWKGTIGKAPGPDGDRRDVKGPIPDLARITWKGRRVTIVFDANVRTNESVQAARALLAKELRSRGAQVLSVDLPAVDGVNGIDDLLARWGQARVAELLEQAQPAGAEATRLPREREFKAISEGRYVFDIPDLAISFEIDRLRRAQQELWGELSVRCNLPGVRTVDGDLSIGDFNLSSVRSRSDRAKLLIERSNVRDLDWLMLLEEFCQRVIKADRAGQPAIDLRDMPKPDPDDTLKVEGLVFPRRHPSVIFGDGGAAKSYTALYLAGRLSQQGLSIALFDWELAGDDHRDRLERLFGMIMPGVLYARCERPLYYEADRLRRIVRDHAVDYALFDSVAFACDGPPEAAEVAGRYFRAVREIGVGSLHIAHVSKGENADKKPFGSAFWHNGARSTWFAKLPEESFEPNVLELGLFNRKSNLGRLQAPVGYRIQFSEERTTYKRTEVGDSPELAPQMTIGQRIAYLLKRGPLTVTQISEQLEVELNTVTQTVNRYVKNGRTFIVLDGQSTNRRIGLRAS